PRPKQVMLRRPRLALAAIYGPPALFLAAMLICYVAFRQLYDPQRIASTSGDVGKALRGIVWSYFPVAAVWYVACVVSLVQSYRRAADVTERNQVKWILFGAAAALVPIGYSLYVIQLDPSALGRGAVTWPMFAASAC